MIHGVSCNCPLKVVPSQAAASDWHPSFFSQNTQDHHQGEAKQANTYFCTSSAVGLASGLQKTSNNKNGLWASKVLVALASGPNTWLFEAALCCSGNRHLRHAPRGLRNLTPDFCVRRFTLTEIRSIGVLSESYRTK